VGAEKPFAAEQYMGCSPEHSLSLRGSGFWHLSQIPQAVVRMIAMEAQLLLVAIPEEQ
jgi:hypothetical protein